MAPFQNSLLVGLGLVCAARGADNVLSLSLSEDVPSDISATVDPSFAGFGIELDHLYYFMGDETPNDLTINLLNNLANFTGRPPHMRLGGNTQDYLIYDDSQDEWLIKPNPRPTAPGNVPADNFIVGPKFMEIANRLPKGTPVTWGLNLGYAESDYIEKLTTMATQIIERCTNINLVSFEFGNEPDLYGDNGFRKGSWTGSVYAQEWLDRARAVWEEVLQPRNLHSNFFEAAASTAWVTGTGFEIEDLEAVLDVKANNSDKGFLNSWNQHNYYYFVGSMSYPLTLDYMMHFDNTKEQFSPIEGQLEQAKNTPYPFALREMSVVGPLGVEGLSDTFAAALWTFNFLFYAATLNISSVQFHMTFDSNASAWQPTRMFGRDRFVRPLYYGMAAFGQAIGRSCTARVAETKVSNAPSGYQEYIKAYSIYQSDALSSVVLINGKLANASEASKGNITVDLTLPSSLADETLHLAYLTSDGADATHGTTWNGISFEQDNTGSMKQVSNEDITVKVEADGKASIVLRDSEAVVVNVGARVGTSEPDPTACDALSSASPGVGTATTSTPGPAGDSSNSSDNGTDNAAANLMPGNVFYGCITWSLAFTLGVLLF
ncbi:glycoside hydrolase family 79 protein [Colletotrichum truncatum]|uniref:Glycoside hydrolase family 79 protein n=1 Tax=Colletotrichum truncatum TaxID=5467 RepID=A0ACC3YYJ7_COLTU|nr:glycoside hydrolase family 79 protein [Colletotrichum truncatum]KAF6782021.1 glycoside hydrolase family 79 protein [Colletotrichum truncatum]